MSSGTPFALNALYLVFLLVPGYASLVGYLWSTVQLDTVSRLDKILRAVVGGSVTLGVFLLAYRFGIPQTVLRSVETLWTGGSNWLVFDPLGYRASRTITARTVGSTPALTLLAVIASQSVVGYVLGYGLGTVVHVRYNDREKSQEDLEQPWETAVRQTALGDRVTVVTNDGVEISGRLYRVGSPSEDYDLLLSGAVRVVRGGDDESLGMTYHHYDDVARVHFERMRPEEIGREANWLVRQWERGSTAVRRVGVLGDDSSDDDSDQ
ncbi:hypothetical protein RYH80_08440 [Halobaculum sp. MBLA0147]|uniref:hypothetical protein n=1 Tax=Halobaculum sp. MBLA0147 TaxID=3079934 RepID=UPI0035264450